MSENWLDIIRELPLTAMALFVLAIWLNIRNSNKRLDVIEKKMISRIEFENLKDDVENMKEEQVWGDVFREFKEAISSRVKRVETALNGLHKR